MKDLLPLSKEICADPDAVAILGARSPTGASLVVSHGANVRLDVRPALSEAAAVIGGKGGGREDFAQGAGPKAEGLEQALLVARRAVEAWLKGQGG